MSELPKDTSQWSNLSIDQVVTQQLQQFRQRMVQKTVAFLKELHDKGSSSPLNILSVGCVPLLTVEELYAKEVVPSCPEHKALGVEKWRRFDMRVITFFPLAPDHEDADGVDINFDTAEQSTLTMIRLAKHLVKMGYCPMIFVATQFGAIEEKTGGDIAMIPTLLVESACWNNLALPDPMSRVPVITEVFDGTFVSPTPFQFYADGEMGDETGHILKAMPSSEDPSDPNSVINTKGMLGLSELFGYYTLERYQQSISSRLAPPMMGDNSRFG